MVSSVFFALREEFSNGICGMKSSADKFSGAQGLFRTLDARPFADAGCVSVIG